MTVAAHLRPGDWILYRGEAVKILAAHRAEYRTVALTFRYDNGAIRYARLNNGDDVTVVDEPDSP